MLHRVQCNLGWGNATEFEQVHRELNKYDTWQNSIVVLTTALAYIYNYQKKVSPKKIRKSTPGHYQCIKTLIML